MTMGNFLTGGRPPVTGGRMTGQRKIGVLMGGLSAERDVSLRSGEAILAALTDRGHDAWPLFVDRDVDLVLRQARIDVAFLALHGRFGDDVLVERFVDGKEISVAVLDGKPVGAVEIVPKRGFYDFHNKYAGGRTDYHLPARLSPERYRSVLRLATLAHEALGCEGASRVDLVVSERGNEVILEVNTLPGMTPTSLLPKIAHSAGLSFEDLVEEI